MADGEVLIDARMDTKQLNKDLDVFGDTAQKAINLLTDPMTALTGGFLMLTKNAVQAGIEFGSGFRAMAMTLGEAEEDVNFLRQEFRQLATEIPVATSTLLDIGKAAGQVGVAKEDITEFTRTIAAVGATTGMVAEEASANFARFAAIIQEPLTSVDRMGAAMVSLANSGAASADEVMAMTMRLAAAGNQAGMSASEIMGFAAALSGLGIEAEAGGSAFSRLFSQIQLAVETGSESLKDFARVSGQSVEDFAKLFKEDAAQAVNLFIKGLADSERSGKSAIQILDEMGVSEIRMRDALLRAAGAGDVMTDMIDRANTAWEENSALTDAVGMKYTSTGSQIQLLKNNMQEVSLTIYDALRPALQGAITLAASLLQVFTQLPEGVKTFLATALLLGGALVTINTAYKALKATKEIITALTKKEAAAEGLNIAAKVSAAYATGGLTAATRALTAAMMANPLFAIGGAVLAIAGIITAVRSLSGSYEDNTEKLQRLNEEYQNAQEEIKNTETELESVRERIEELSDLQDKGKIDVAGENELQNLQRVNRELEAQIILQERIADAAVQEKQAAAVDALSASYKVARYEIDGLTDRVWSYDTVVTGLNEKVAAEVKWAQKLEDQLALLQARRTQDIELGKENTKAYKNREKAIADLEKTLAEHNSTLMEDFKTLQEFSDAIDDSTEAGKAQKAAYEETIEIFIKHTDALKTSTAAAKGNTDAADNMAAAMAENVKTAKELSGEIDALSDAFDENGNAIALTDKQLLDLIDSGEISKIVFDAETGAAHLDTDSMLELADAKLTLMEQSLETQKTDLTNTINSEAEAAVAAAGGHLNLAQALLAVNAARKDEFDAIDAQLAIIDNLRQRLANVGSGGGSRSSGRGGGGARAQESREEVSEILKNEMELLKRKKDLREIDDYEYRESLDTMLQNNKLNSKEREALDKELHNANVAVMRETEKAQKAAIEESYSAEKDRVDRVKALLKDQETTAVEIYTEGSTERLDIVSREYLERIRWIDEESGVYDAAANEQMRLEFDRSREALLNKEAELQAELDLISVTNAGLYEQIMAIRERNEEIKAGQEARREAAQEERDAKTEADLLAKIALEEDFEKLQTLQEQLATHRAEVAERKLVKRENEEIKVNSEKIAALQQTIAENTAEMTDKAKAYNDEVKNTVDLMTEALESGQSGEFNFSINVEGIKTGADQALKQLEGLGGEMLIKMGIDKVSMERVLTETANTVQEHQKPLNDEITLLSDTAYNLMADTNKRLHDRLLADIKSANQIVLDEMARFIQRLREMYSEAQSIVGAISAAVGSGSTVIQNFYNVQEEETAYRAGREVQRVNAMGGEFN